jgi:hypothetical protein
MLDILNPTEDDVKLLTGVLVVGRGDVADSHVDTLATPALRVFAKLALRALADVKKASTVPAE